MSKELDNFEEILIEFLLTIGRGTKYCDFTDEETKIFNILGNISTGIKLIRFVDMGEK